MEQEYGQGGYNAGGPSTLRHLHVVLLHPASEDGVIVIAKVKNAYGIIDMLQDEVEFKESNLKYLTANGTQLVYC